MIEIDTRIRTFFGGHFSLPNLLLHLETTKSLLSIIGEGVVPSHDNSMLVCDMRCHSLEGGTEEGLELDLSCEDWNEGFLQIGLVVIRVREDRIYLPDSAGGQFLTIKEASGILISKIQGLLPPCPKG